MGNIVGILFSAINYKLEVICNCEKFIKDLLIFTRKILSDGNEHQNQWKKFKIFLEQNSCRIIRDENGSLRKPCSEKFCNEMLKRKNEWCKINLKSLLLNIISVIYQDQSKSTQCVLKFLECVRIFHRIYGDLEKIHILSAIDGKSEYMKLLINFNLIQDWGRIFPYSTWFFCREFWDLMMTMDIYRHEEKIEKIMVLIDRIRLHPNYHISYRRFILTAIAIKAAVLCVDTNECRVKAKEYIYCLRLLFTAIQDPFITINEIRIVLYACLTAARKSHLFESLYEEFIKLMPECPVKLEPRNLTDLARCKVRENLKKCNLTLSAAVDKLSIPKPMKEFLLGNVIEMSRKSGNVSPGDIITKSQIAKLASLPYNELFHEVMFITSRNITYAQRALSHLNEIELMA